MRTEPELLNERLDRLALVLDEIMPNCALLVRDALELLKEQETVEPIPYHRSDGTIFKYECKQCRTKIFKMDLFCRHCGRAVKWK